MTASEREVIFEALIEAVKTDSLGQISLVLHTVATAYCQIGNCRAVLKSSP